MRTIIFAIATTSLLVSAAPAAACEWHGAGGSRFFAFSNMYRGGAPQQDASQAAQQSDTGVSASEASSSQPSQDPNDRSGPEEGQTSDAPPENIQRLP